MSGYYNKWSATFVVALYFGNITFVDNNFLINRAKKFM